MRAYLLVALLVAAALAGCSDKKDDDGDGAGTSTTGPAGSAAVLYLNLTLGNQTFSFQSGANATGHGGHGGSASASSSTGPAGNGTAAGNATGNATGNSTGPSGTAPVAVTATLGAKGLGAGAVRWTLDFGAGGNATAGNGTANGTSPGRATGSSLPATANHTYAEPGDYNVTFVVQAGNRTVDTVKATVRVGNGTGNVTVTPALPAVTHYEYGESLGCTGDVSPTGIVCIDWESGPPGSDVDGHWIPLDASYWGLAVTSTIDQSNPAVADSDCVFTDADQAILAEGNNGGDPCMGTVPEGAAWLFIYAYGLPAAGMTVDFALPA